MKLQDVQVVEIGDEYKIFELFGGYRGSVTKQGWWSLYRNHGLVANGWTFETLNETIEAL